MTSNPCKRMENTKQDRLLELFFRGLRGENLSVQKLTLEYGVSTKSITRTINDLKTFLADHRDLTGNAELLYSHQDKCYRLRMDEFLTNFDLNSADPLSKPFWINCPRPGFSTVMKAPTWWRRRYTAMVSKCGCSARVHGSGLSHRTAL